MEIDKKKRQQKTSFEQKEIYCSFMEANPIINQKKHSDASVQTVWNELVMLLNATRGPTHSIDEWKTIFDNWRYAVTYKLRQEKNSIKKTGGGSPSSKNLLEKLEERAIACWGKIVIDGHKNVPVAGCSNFEPEFNDENKENWLKHPPQPQVKRPRKEIPLQHRTDDEVLRFLEQNQSTRLTIGETIIDKLDKIATSIDNLTAAQESTANALNKLISIFEKQN